jgi:hypothetical protein
MGACTKEGAFAGANGASVGSGVGSGVGGLVLLFFLVGALRKLSVCLCF